LILVEVTKRKSSSADGEFIAVTDHLDRAVKAGGYSDYAVLYVSPATSARLSSSFRDLGIAAVSGTVNAGASSQSTSPPPRCC